MASEIEEFRKQLIGKNPDTSKNKAKQVADDLIIAFEALDRITDNLGELMDETECKDCLCVLAQIRGEMCLHYNAIADTLQDYGEGIEAH